MDTYDIAVIGAGPGGYVAAIKAGQLGMKVACIEKDERLGGTCLLRGCIPTKAVLESAHLYEAAREGAEFGVIADNVRLDFPGVKRRKDRVVEKHAKGVEFLFRKNNVAWVKGTARIEGEGRLSVKGADGAVSELRAKAVLLATGSAPRLIPGVSLDGKRVVTSDELLEFTEAPRSLIVIGAGAVGVEFASAYRRFGSEVTVVEMLPRLVPVEDEQVSEELERAFRKRKIKSWTGTKVESVSTTGEGVSLAVSKGDKHETLAAETLLVATGRRPVTEGLGLEKTRAKVDRGYVFVNAQMRTAEPWLYAIGDIVALEGRPHPQLAHLASMEGQVAVEAIAGKNPAPVNYDQIPGCTYCEPEIASVGLSEKAAKERGHEVKVGVFPFSANGKATILAAGEGFVKIVADARYDEVLGVHMIGPRVTELIAEAGAAMRLETTSEELFKTIHAHPTLSEAVAEAAHAVRGKAIHV
jgi:dihydrolipoamide dehydrogenase